MIKKVTMYSVVCDRCGKVFSADDIVAWSDEYAANEQAIKSGWLERKVKHYCSNCCGYEESIALMSMYLSRKEVRNEGM